MNDLRDMLLATLDEWLMWADGPADRVAYQRNRIAEIRARVLENTLENAPTVSTDDSRK